MKKELIRLIAESPLEDVRHYVFRMSKFVALTFFRVLLIALAFCHLHISSYMSKNICGLFDVICSGNARPKDGYRGGAPEKLNIPQFPMSNISKQLQRSEVKGLLLLKK